MCGQFKKARLRWGAVCLLALFLLGAVRIDAAAVRSETEAERLLVPVGHTVGVKLFSRGVLVVKPPEGGTPAEACGLRSGDVILRCGAESVTSTEQFQTLLQKHGETAAALEVRRAGDHLTLSVEPERNEQGVYCIGAWIRDSMAGIGTVTYYDPETGTFGALGHGITDVDTRCLMPFANGAILPSAVKAVKKGQEGAAGELRGEFDLKRELGQLTANTDCGVFGRLDDASLAAQEALPVGSARRGDAVIRANVRGNAVEEYAIRILRVLENAKDSRDMVIEVTDPNLIALTGGIVQGMSGSPIIQDGKLVGAVTHVLVNDPTRGYGIFIENMLAAAG